MWGHASINFSTMLEVINFDLDNCYGITYDGRLLKQARGIPMGSALSPPLAIGTLAWMERSMDDVITVTAKDDGAWDVDRFREDFRRSECYCVLGAFEVGGSRERSFFRERRLLSSKRTEVSGRDSRT